MSEPLYVVHENHLGEKRYQPRTDVGRRAWWGDDIRGSWAEWHYGETGHPILYRSRRRAERMARREMRRFAREERDTFKAVSEGYYATTVDAEDFERYATDGEAEP